MTWIFLAIGSHFAWAIENVVSKYAVEKRIKNPVIFLVLFSLMEFLVVLLIPFVDFFAPSWPTLLLLAVAGFIYFYGGLPYIKALQAEEVSRINILWNLIPLMTLFLGYFIGDRLNWLEFGALIMLVFGAVLASIHAGAGKWRFSRAFWLMFLSCICFSFYGVILRYLTQQIPFLVVFIWVLIFNSIAALSVLFHSGLRQEFKQTVKEATGDFWWLLFGVSLIALFGAFMNQSALKLKQASLVFSFEGFQAIFVFIIAVLLTIFAPHLIKEEIDKRNVILKLLALAFMVVGVVVLNFK